MKAVNQKRKMPAQMDYPRQAQVCFQLSSFILSTVDPRLTVHLDSRFIESWFTEVYNMRIWED